MPPFEYEQGPEMAPEEVEFDSVHQAIVYLSISARIDQDSIVIDNEHQISLKNQEGIYLTQLNPETGKIILTDWGIKIVYLPELKEKQLDLEILRAQKVTKQQQSTRKKIVRAVNPHVKEKPSVKKAKHVLRGKPAIKRKKNMPWREGKLRDQKNFRKNGGSTWDW